MIAAAPPSLRLAEPLAPGWSAYLDADWLPAAEGATCPSLLRAPDGTLIYGGSKAVPPARTSADDAAASVFNTVAGAALEVVERSRARTIDVVGHGIVASLIRRVSAPTVDGPVDLIVHTTSSPADIVDALARLRDHGTLVLAGAVDWMSIDLYGDAHRRGLHLIGAPHPLASTTRSWAPLPGLEPPASIRPGEQPPPGAAWYRVAG